MPIDFECAALALDVYREKDRPALPDGWVVYIDYIPGTDDKDYFGACYINQPYFNTLPDMSHTSSPQGQYLEDINYPTDIVIAHRGSIMTVDNLYADLCQLTRGNVPMQYANAKNFYDSTIIKLKKDFPAIASSIENIVSLVGHSLGSIIAEIMCAATFGDSPGFVKRSVSFESPGSKPIIEKMIKEKSLPSNALGVANNNCYIIQTHPDLINTCNEQANDEIQTLNTPFNYNVMDGPITDVPSECIYNYYYTLGYSFSDQHKIQHIYDYLKKGGYSTGASAWAYGFENGYDAYKDYLLMENYWDGYIQICWNTHPEVRADYKGDYVNYQTWFISKYLNNPDKQKQNKWSHYPKIGDETGRPLLFNHHNKPGRNAPHFFSKEYTEIEKQPDKINEKESCCCCLIA